MPAIIVLLLVLSIAAGAFLVAGPSATSPGQMAASAQPLPTWAEGVPVTVTEAKFRDMPVTIDALGTVQASALVTVRTQVDGTLEKIAFREGQEVKAGDVLARIDQRVYQAAVNQAAARLRQDQSQLANAMRDLNRYQTLAAKNFASSQQVDTTRASVDQFAAQVAQDQAQLDSVSVQLDHTVITSPIDGLTSVRQVDAGNVVHPTDPAGIVVITTLQPINVVFSLPQQALRRVSAALAKGKPEVVALAQDDEKDVLDKGALTVLDNQVDPSTGTIKLKAEFSNVGRKLWPGGFVTVRLLADVRHHAVVVPLVAIQRGPSGSYVYVLADNGTAVRRDIVAGPQDATVAVIESGVAAGDQVVTDGAALLTNGAPVKVVAAPAAITAGDGTKGSGI